VSTMSAARRFSSRCSRDFAPGIGTMKAPAREPWVIGIEGFKIPRLRSDAPFTSLRELSDFNAEHADPTRFAQTLIEMQIPSTLDGELPSRAFDPHREARILIGERYLVPDADGREVPGELVSAAVTESDMSMAAVMRLNDGTHLIVRMPITQDELNAYRECFAARGGRSGC
jgi:hypothetical protein